MASTYSIRLGALTLVNAVTVMYTVPAGFVVVLRNMTIGWSVGAGAGGQATVQLGGSNSRIWVRTIVESTLGSDLWEGRVVMPAGESLRASLTGTGAAYFTASGYLLSAP